MGSLNRGLLFLGALVLYGTPTLPAHVPPCTVMGRIVDHAGEPVPGALVLVDGAAEPVVTSGPDGSFRLEGIAPDARVLSLWAAGFAPRDLELGYLVGTRDVGVVTLEEGGEPLATLTGAVSDAGSGAPVPGAEVRLNGGRTVVTDDRGAFRLEDARVSWGHNTLAVRHLSFADAAHDVWIIDSQATTYVPVSLDPVPVELPGVFVGGERAPNATAPSGFEERRASTQGHFIDRAEIQARNPGSVTELLRTVPGVRVRPSPQGTELVFTRRTRSMRGANASGDSVTLPNECRAPVIYLDGALASGDTDELVEIDDFAHSDEIAGVEVYNGAARIPTIFNRMGAGCGVLAIWTVRYRPSTVPVPAMAGDARASDVGRGGLRRVVIGAAVVSAVALSSGPRCAACSITARPVGRSAGAVCGAGRTARLAGPARSGASWECGPRGDGSVRRPASRAPRESLRPTRECAAC